MSAGDFLLAVDGFIYVHLSAGLDQFVGDSQHDVSPHRSRVLVLGIACDVVTIKCKLFVL